MLINLAETALSFISKNDGYYLHFFSLLSDKLKGLFAQHSVDIPCHLVAGGLQTHTANNTHSPFLTDSQVEILSHDVKCRSCNERGNKNRSMSSSFHDLTLYYPALNFELPCFYFLTKVVRHKRSDAMKERRQISSERLPLKPARAAMWEPSANIHVVSCHQHFNCLSPPTADVLAARCSAWKLFRQAESFTCHFRGHTESSRCTRGLWQVETNVSQNGREGRTLAHGFLLTADRKIKSVMKGEVFWPTKGLPLHQICHNLLLQPCFFP